MDMNVRNSKVLKFSAQQTELYYDSANEVMYVINDSTIYKYKGITLSVWTVISSGDKDFFESVMMATPYTIVSKVPKGGVEMYHYTLPVPSVIMYSVNSSNVAYAGYDKEKKRLYVEFLTGDVYEYYDVEEEIWNGLQRADSKGSYIHWFVVISDYRYDKVSGYELDYTGDVMRPNSGTPHSSGYMTGFQRHNKTE